MQSLVRLKGAFGVHLTTAVEVVPSLLILVINVGVTITPASAGGETEAGGQWGVIRRPCGKRVRAGIRARVRAEVRHALTGAVMQAGLYRRMVLPAGLSQAHVVPQALCRVLRPEGVCPPRFTC